MVNDTDAVPPVMVIGVVAVTAPAVGQEAAVVCAAFATPTYEAAATMAHAKASN